MTWNIVFLLVVGLTLLTVGAELLIRGAAKLAATFGISPLVIGLTVVAFGTSAPELAVSVKAALYGESDLALGNVVGSNIFNVLFILGLCSMILPLRVHSQLIRLDVPIMIAASVLLFLFSNDGVIGRGDGLLFILMMLAYTYFMVYSSKQENKEKSVANQALQIQSKNKLGLSLLFVIFGLALLVYGADLFVQGAIEVARAFGISELVIGLTIVAAGTSLPEVAASIIATFKGEREIAIGNVIGSNIFNIFSVLGISACISPITVSPQAYAFDIPVMLAVAFFCFPIFITGMILKRWNGALLFFYYLSYTAYLLLASSGHESLPWFKSLFMSYVLPATVVILMIDVIADWKLQKLPASSKKL